MLLFILTAHLIKAVVTSSSSPQNSMQLWNSDCDSDSLARGCLTDRSGLCRREFGHAKPHHMPQIAERFLQLPSAPYLGELPWNSVQ